MKIFKYMHEPFIEPEFCNLLGKFLPITYIGGIPTDDGKRTFFWSTIKFDNIKQQYLVGYGIKRPLKYYFIKSPASYAETFNAYEKKFRNQVRKAMKNNLSVEVCNGTEHKYVQICYDIYRENVIRLKSIFVPYEFFHGLCKLSYSKLYIIRANNEVVSFGLLLGNLLDIQASNQMGRDLCANNLLYDSIYRDFESESVFLGTSYLDSGHYKFKLGSGARPVPVAPLNFAPMLYQSILFKDNKFVSCVRYIIGKIIHRDVFKGRVF